MTPSHIISSLLLAASHVASLPASSSPHAICKNLTIPVTMTSEVAEFEATKWTDNTGLTDLITDLVSRNSNVQPPLGASKNVTAGYKIGATFCSPADSSAKHHDTMILATHGGGFDRS